MAASHRGERQTHLMGVTSSLARPINRARSLAVVPRRHRLSRANRGTRGACPITRITPAAAARPSQTARLAFAASPRSPGESLTTAPKGADDLVPDQDEAGSASVDGGARYDAEAVSGDSDEYRPD
jgi:hypothetical protein